MWTNFETSAFINLIQNKTADQFGSATFIFDFIEAYKDFSESDLKKDGSNHGTMVVGIIALRGPINVRIINYKVTLAHHNELFSVL